MNMFLKNAILLYVEPKCTVVGSGVLETPPVGSEAAIRGHVTCQPSHSHRLSIKTQ